MDEIWKNIPSQEGYQVSNLGRVRSLDRVIETSTGPRNLRGRVLKQSRGGHRYLTVVLNGQKTFATHVLVLTTFVGPKPPNHEACHNESQSSVAKDLGRPTSTIHNIVRRKSWGWL